MSGHLFSQNAIDWVGWNPMIIDVSDNRCKKFTFFWKYGEDFISMKEGENTIKKIPFDAPSKNIEGARKAVSDYINKNSKLMKN